MVALLLIVCLHDGVLSIIHWHFYVSFWRHAHILHVATWRHLLGRRSGRHAPFKSPRTLGGTCGPGGGGPCTLKPLCMVRGRHSISCPLRHCGGAGNATSFSGVRLWYHFWTIRHCIPSLLSWSAFLFSSPFQPLHSHMLIILLMHLVS